MDKVLNYLQRVPLGLLFGAVLLCVIIYFALPLRSRLPMLLAAVCVWLTASICPQLGVFKDLLKILLPGILGLLVFTAYRDPAPRRALPTLCHLYIVMALAQFLYVLNTPNRVDAMAYCLQGLLMTLAAHRIVEGITSWARLRLIVTSLGIGLTLGTLFILSSFHNREYSLTGGRYHPYGAHPNHIAVTFILSATLCFLYSQQPVRNRTKLTMMLLGSIGLVQLLMTVSRTSIAAALPPIGFLFLHYCKRPAHIVMAFMVLSVVILYGIDKTSKFNYSRLSTLNTPRDQIYEDYFKEVEARPFTGLMFSRNRSMFSTDETTVHAHSSYLFALYVGGLSYAVPLFLLAAASLFSALHIWMNQTLLNHRLFPVLCMLLVSCYLIGLTVAELYKPVSILAFIHLFLAMLIISIATDRERFMMLRRPD